MVRRGCIFLILRLGGVRYDSFSADRDSERRDSGEESQIENDSVKEFCCERAKEASGAGIFSAL